MTRKRGGMMGGNQRTKTNKEGKDKTRERSMRNKKKKD